MKVFKYIGLILGPVLCLLLAGIGPIVGDPMLWKVLGVASLMLIWWITEAVPIPVTSLLPIVLFPLLGVMKIEEACSPYANKIVFLFLGGFMIAIAMEKWNLHRRFALLVVRMTGTKANQIILGFMLSSFLLSMWISNTATTVMMLPIASSVIKLFMEHSKDLATKGSKNFAVSMLLGIAYGANIGGMATLIGTPPNLVLAGILSEKYQYEIGFFQWMKLGLPLAIIMLVVCFVLLVLLLYPNRIGSFSAAGNLIEGEYKKLGPMKTGEVLVMVVFALTALLWIIRKPLTDTFSWLKLNDTIIAIAGTVLLFIIPANIKKGKPLMNWDYANKLPWGILLLFGGGLALANGMKVSGLINLITNFFAAGSQSISLLLFLGIVFLALFMTEVMSNVALTNVLVPVVAGIALGLGKDVLYLSVPVTFAASCAFMLPMATPPNAIVFASGKIKIPQMMGAGIVLNLIAIVLISLFCYFLMPVIWGL